MASQFQQVMSDLGYKLEEQEGLKLTYQKNAKFATLVLVINLELKYIDPILVPSSVILYEREILSMLESFKELHKDANFILDKSNGLLQVLNQEDV